MTFDEWMLTQNPKYRPTAHEAGAAAEREACASVCKALAEKASEQFPLDGTVSRWLDDAEEAILNLAEN